MRIGGVPYGVGAPLLEGLREDPAVELRRDPPSELAQMLRDDTLDAALLSSIEGFRQPGYRALGDICIASRGPARSVRAFVRPGTIRTVGLDSGSETSVALLRILLGHGLFGDVAADVRFERITPTLRPGELPHDLVMMIGDCGLHADPGDRTPRDLGAGWFELTGLPFVYALWLLTPTADASRLVPRLLRAREDSVAAQVDDGTAGAIYYEFGPDEHAGLRRFHTEAAALDLADPDLELTFLNRDSGDSA